MHRYFGLVCHMVRISSSTAESRQDKVIWFGSRAALKKLNADKRTLQVGSSTIQSSTVVRDLGVHLDAELSMKQHINKTTATCYYHLRRLRQIRRRAGTEVTVRLVQAFVISRLDYCNSVLAALPETAIRPLQHVGLQNAAARLIFSLKTFDHKSRRVSYNCTDCLFAGVGLFNTSYVS